MKLRCLNGTHSVLAYIGYLVGFNTLAECVSCEFMVNYIQYLWERNCSNFKNSRRNVENYCMLLEYYQNPL